MSVLAISPARGAAHDPIPITLVGGYLGAGKTTLVNHLLGSLGGGSFAVVVNGFGPATLDAGLIARRGVELVRLGRGCICRERQTEFVLPLARLRSRLAPPSHLVVEASGISDPARIAEPADLHGFRLETILVTERERQSVRDWLRELAPDARVVETRYGRIPPSLVLDWTVGGAAALARARDREPARFAQALDAGAFRWWVATLPVGLLRGKGVLYVGGDPARRYVFQLVGRRWTLEPGSIWELLAAVLLPDIHGPRLTLPFSPACSHRVGPPIIFPPFPVHSRPARPKNP